MIGNTVCALEALDPLEAGLRVMLGFGEDLGFRVLGFGIGVWDFGIQGLEFRAKDWASGFRDEAPTNNPPPRI